MKKQIAWIFGGLSVACVGMVASLSACSGDDSTTTDGGGKDSTADTTTGPDTGTDSATDAGNDVSTVDCGSTPTLHTSEAGTIFCGYPADGGSSFSCTSGNQCCLGGKNGNTFLPEDCVTWGGACDNPAPDSGTLNAVPIECNQNADCEANGQGGSACCLQGAGAPAVVAGCGYYKSQGGTAVACEATDAGACNGSGEIRICAQQSDCPQGKTCTPMKWKLYQLGFCL